VLGRADIIKSLGRDAVANYMKTTYAAPGMLLVAAGNITHEALVAMAERSFNALGAKSEARTEPGHYEGGEHRELRELEQAHVLIGFPGFPFGDRDYFAASVVSTAFGGGMSSRLFQEVREKRGLAYSIYSFSHSYSDGGIFGIYAGTGEDEAADLMPVLRDELIHLVKGLTGAELARARAQHKAGLLMSLEGTTARCEQRSTRMRRSVWPSELSAASRRWRRSARSGSLKSWSFSRNV
jgi:predicted Zn-dependent peptidase